jgi:hypothetical protein
MVRKRSEKKKRREERKRKGAQKVTVLRTDLSSTHYADTLSHHWS